MSAPRGVARRRLLVLPTLLVLALLLAVLAPLRSVQAHPLDVYLQAAYITVAPKQIVVELDLTPGVLVAPNILPALDANGDHQISDAEGRAYVESILRDVTLQVDGKPLTLTVTKIEMPSYLIIQAGYGTIRVFTTATLAAGMTGTHSISFKNAYAPKGSAYQVNAFVDDGVPITLGKQQRDSIQQSMTVGYTIGTSGTASADSSNKTTADAPGQARRLLSYLDAPRLSVWELLLALALAVVLGGLHALTPGHGKTLVAACLVSSRGTVRHAAVLGTIVTITHTASVIVIGLLALFASQFVMPSLLVPAMEVLCGLLVVSLGARLVWQRGIALPRRRGHPRLHRHGHDHGDGPGHSHLSPQSVSMGSLVTMGVSGGLVPCPEALGIMIMAIGLNRIGLGLGLIVSFSVGLAAVLIGIGVLLVRSRALVDRFGGRGGRWNSVLPLASAVIVTVLGLGIVVKGVASYGDLPGFGRYLATLAGILLVAVLLGKGVTVLIRKLRGQAPRPAGQAHALAGTGPLVPLELLPPRYRDGHLVSSAPMAAAPLVYDASGQVAWNRIWGGDDPSHPFCDLALAGGPPHRGTRLEPATADAVAADPAGFSRARAELERGLRMVTGLDVTTDAAPGWLGLVCTEPEMAVWLALAINAENVAARQDGTTVFLPIGPSFRLDQEIKNVVTAVAKAHHYWTEHVMADSDMVFV